MGQHAHGLGARQVLDVLGVQATLRKERKESELKTMKNHIKDRIEYRSHRTEKRQTQHRDELSQTLLLIF